MTKPQIKSLDRKWSLIIRELGHCEVCGKTHENCQLHAHHRIGRRNRTLRWDRRNGVCLCASHHKLDKQSAHEDPQWFEDWFTENRTEDDNYVRVQKNKILKQTYEEVMGELDENKL